MNMASVGMAVLVGICLAGAHQYGADPEGHP